MGAGPRRAGAGHGHPALILEKLAKAALPHLFKQVVGGATLGPLYAAYEVLGWRFIAGAIVGIAIFHGGFRHHLLAAVWALL